MRTKLGLLCMTLMLSFSMFVVPVNAGGLMGAMNDALDAMEDTKANPPKDKGSVTDIFGSMSNYTTPDEEVMTEAVKVINASPLGIVISVLVIGCTASIGLMVGIDLIYIAFPPIRSLLYTGDTQGTQMGRQGYNNQVHTQQLGNQGQNGTQTGQVAKKRQIVSDELIQVERACKMRGIPFSLTMYFKKKVFVIVLFVIAIALFTSSAITDFGLNVGDFILRFILQFK